MGYVEAKYDDVVASLIVSADGMLLYGHFGFKDLRRMVIQAPGDEANVFNNAMVLEFGGEKGVLVYGIPSPPVAEGTGSDDIRQMHKVLLLLKNLPLCLKK